MTGKPTRIQLRRTRGWRLPAGAVVVSHPTRWGNPYTLAEYNRLDAVAAYQRWLATCPDLVSLARRDISGRDLACWCPPGQPCHGDVLLFVANNRTAPDATDPAATGHYPVAWYEECFHRPPERGPLGDAHRWDAYDAWREHHEWVGPNGEEFWTCKPLQDRCGPCTPPNADNDGPPSVLWPCPTVLATQTALDTTGHQPPEGER